MDNVLLFQKSSAGRHKLVLEDISLACNVNIFDAIGQEFGSDQHFSKNKQISDQSINSWLPHIYH